MSRTLKTCPTCGRRLIDGPDQSRTAKVGKFQVTIEGIPTRVCPAGCEGLYWYWRDLGVSVLDMTFSRPEYVARLRRGLFKSRQLCRECRLEIGEDWTVATFRFEAKSPRGTLITMTATVPALRCPGCGRLHMPAQTAPGDPYYADLAEAISVALTDNLRWK
ncbi:MAG TPA: hypothetical protein ENI95_05960 [Chloroflexi bacterium]|nr:hypothetical protein [Chloroflexota bacterium]